MTAPDTPTAEAPTAITHLPLVDVVPDPRNQRRRVDADLIASVRSHGILEPILVRPDGDNRYRLVAGERRWRAAAKAGLDRVPAIVRTLTATEVAEIQLAENFARVDLAPSQAAAAMARCIEVGMTQKDLAARIGRSQRWVSARLRLLELPSEARALVDDGTWSVDDAALLHRLLDHPEELGSIIDARPADLAWSVRRTLAELDRRASIEALVADADAAGRKVVPWEGWSPSTYRPLEGHGAIGVECDAHAAEPCHAVTIPPSGEPKVVPVCTEPRRHTTRGASSVKSINGGGGEAANSVERAERAARRQADDARRTFIRTRLDTRIRRSDALALILSSYLDEANTAESAAACALLDLAADKGPYGDDWHAPLRRYGYQSEATLVRASLAVALAQADTAIRHGSTWGGRADRALS